MQKFNQENFELLFRIWISIKKSSKYQITYSYDQTNITKKILYLLLF